MATFAIGQEIVTRLPIIEVDAGLPAGFHRFALVVETLDGRTSKPDVGVVQVLARGITFPDRVIVEPFRPTGGTPVVSGGTIGATPVITRTPTRPGGEE